MLAIASLNQALFPHDCTISLLVIANACSDDTIARLKKLQLEQNIKNFPLSFYEEPIPGKSYALNRAIKMVNDGFICFVDDDQRVDKNYFQSIQTAINTYPKISFFCGPLRPDWTGLEPNWIHTQGKYKIYPEPIPHFELGYKSIKVNRTTRLPSGGTLIVKKELFNQIGEFSTTLGPQGHNLVGGEDSDFILRTLDAGVAIQYIPDILQFHYVDINRLKLPYLILGSFQRTRSFTLLNNPLPSSVPLYMWKKLFNYLFRTLFSFNMVKIRFYLMRIASTSGEMVGLLQKRTY